MTAFCGLGEWKGNAEVYDGAGRYLGSGVDQRHVRTPQEDGRLRIDLAFLGPFRLAGHYFIRDAGDYRVYEGPANLGVAEAIAEDLVDADHYWPAIGMSQRFFLMMMPGGQRQLSLALLSRGEGLVYAVVGENQREGTCAPAGALPSVASVDVADDPATGRGAVLVHRPGT